MYERWVNIKRMCYGTSHPSYPSVGGKGITIDPEWASSYLAFKEYVEQELGPPPSNKALLARIDKSKNYEPGNLMWLKDKQAAFQRTRNV